jgi:succinate dehydrogenase (ubiquinone) cytochrome b560 subunit
VITIIQRDEMSVGSGYRGAVVSRRTVLTPRHRQQVTQQHVSSENNEILVAQRKLRPVSPHLGIYKPQITWIPSMFNRITGAILSGGFYLFALGYLVAPVFGWHLESAVLAASFATWPIAAKVLAKMSLALPFTFHSFNGLRHLMWDVAKGITNQQVARTGWFVVGLSFVSAFYLAIGV